MSSELDYNYEHHWLDKVSEDHGISIHKLALLINVKTSSLYSIVTRGSQIENIRYQTIEDLSKQLDYPNVESFVNKYRIYKGVRKDSTS